MIDDKDNLLELPKGWVWSSLGNVSIKITKGSTPTSYGYSFKKEGINFVKTENIDGNGNIENITDFIDQETNVFLKRSILKLNDILFSIAGTIGRVGIVKEEDLPANTNQALAIIRCLDDFIKKDYIFYFLKSPLIQREALKSIVGVGRANVSLTNLSEFALPLPPFPEQHRIVDKIEELFSKLDAGVKSLKKAKAQLKRYRQSVLKSAMEARLTEESRNLQEDWVSGQRLLEKAEKKSNINKYKTQGKLTKIDKTLLYDVPDSWAWGQVGDVCEAIRYGTSDKAKKEFSGVPVLRMGDIQNGNLKFNDLKFMPEDWDEEKLLLKAGDVLFNRTNSMELVGKTAVYKEHHPTCTFASYLVRAKVFDDVYSPEFLAFYTNSFYGHRYIRSVVNQQVGQANVNATKFASMPIPIPSLEEQHKIVEEIERRFSVVDEVEKVVDSELKRAERLRHSILKQAFSGKLVPQDSDDEPASVLLERIEKEKERKESVKSSKKKSKAKTDAKQLNLF